MSARNERHKYDTSNTSETPVLHERYECDAKENFDFEMTLVKTYFYTLIFTI